MIAVATFTTTEQAIRAATDTDQGWAVSVWTGSVQRAVIRVRSGVLRVNTSPDMPSEAPVGGTRASGDGRENRGRAIGESAVIKTVDFQNPSTFGRSLWDGRAGRLREAPALSSLL